MPKGGTSPIVQEDQPTYQGLLNDNSEFMSMILYPMYHATDFLSIWTAIKKLINLEIMLK